MNTFMSAAEQIALFCRLNLNVKKDIPIRSSEMGLLIYLVKSEQEPTPLAAARYFKVSKGMITNMVTSLAKKGYITKEKSTSDRRSCLLIATARAEELVNQTYDENYKVMNALQEGLGREDFEQLTQLLERANTILLEEKNG